MIQNIIKYCKDSYEELVFQTGMEGIYNWLR